MYILCEFSCEVIQINSPFPLSVHGQCVAGIYPFWLGSLAIRFSLNSLFVSILSKFTVFQPEMDFILSAYKRMPKLVGLDKYRTECKVICWTV